MVSEMAAGMSNPTATTANSVHPPTATVQRTALLRPVTADSSAPPPATATTTQASRAIQGIARAARGRSVDAGDGESVVVMGTDLSIGYPWDQRERMASVMRLSNRGTIRRDAVLLTKISVMGNGVVG